MKKLTTIIAGLFLLFSASGFTTPDVNVSKTIKASFERDFASSSNVVWAKAEDVYIASFKALEKNMSAVYNEEGQLLSVRRAVTFEQVPISVTLAMQEKYSGYSINNSVTELFAEGSTMYFINAENDKHIVRIQADTAGNLTVISKTKKK